ASLLSGRRQHAMLPLAAARACLSSPAPPPRPQPRAAPLSPLHRRRSTATLPRPARIPLLRPLGATAGAGASSRPARDHVIEFGKHKGQMLGTLPPSYLRWVVAELDCGDTLVWARLAREVLDDPVYVNRVEWEHAHRFLRGDSKFDYVYNDGDGALQEMAERFGWDLSDEDGWASSAPPTLAASRGRPTGARAPAAEAAATDPPAAAAPCSTPGRPTRTGRGGRGTRGGSGRGRGGRSR
uniref:Uncharacterized protein n=3 Tax=Aegilops tauschii subsp. strangulata TaxID=200361 RepID=A0A453DLA5_AEGTS